MNVMYLIMLYIDWNVGKKFQPSTFYRSRENQFWKIKASKKLQSNRYGCLYSIMLHIDGNVDKTFQPSIFYKSRKNQLWKL